MSVLLAARGSFATTAASLLPDTNREREWSDSWLSRGRAVCPEASCYGCDGWRLDASVFDELAGLSLQSSASSQFERA